MNSHHGERRPTLAERNRASLRAAFIYALGQEGHPVRTGELRYVITKHNPGLEPGPERLAAIRRELAAERVTTEYVDTNQRFAPTMVTLTGAATWVVPAPVLDGIADTVTIAVKGIPDDAVRFAIRTALAAVITGHGGTIACEIHPERRPLSSRARKRGTTSTGQEDAR